MKFASTLPARSLAVALAALAAAPAAARAQADCRGEPTTTRLHIVVQGVRSSLGVMTATLYGDDARKFLRGSGELKVWRYPANAPTTEQCVYLPAPGVYAVAVYHDAKRAYRFTQGAFGRPTQDFGFSRNPHLFLGPPSLGSAKFPAGEGDTTVVIRLKYP